MLKKLKVISNFFIECFMFSVAGLIGVFVIPFVIGAVWIELFKEAKDEFKKVGKEVEPEMPEKV